MRKLTSLTVLGSALILSVGGVAVAHAVTTTPNPINACVTKSTGGVRIVSSTSQCKSNEAPYSWNTQGVPGTNGTNGTNGTDGVSGYEIVSADRLVPSGGVQSSLEADCPSGKKVLGGGVLIVDPDGSEHVSGGGLNADVSGPLSDGSGYYVGFFAPAGLAGYTIRAQATCATVTP